MIAALLFTLLAADAPKPEDLSHVLRIMTPQEMEKYKPVLSVPCVIIDEKTAKCTPSPVDEARMEAAKAIIAIREAELDEKGAYAAYLEAQGRKAKAAAALEAAKQKLPGWKPGALLTPDFRIAEEPKKQ